MVSVPTVGVPPHVGAEVTGGSVLGMGVVGSGESSAMNTTLVGDGVGS